MTDCCRLLPMLLLLPVVELNAAAPPASRRDIHGDPLPVGAIARLGTVRLRYGTDCNPPNLFFSPDGRELIACGGGVRRWDVATGKALPWLHRAYWAGAMRLLPDGKTVVVLATTPGDNLTYCVERRVWGATDLQGRVKLPLKAWMGVFSPDGKRLVRWNVTEEKDNRPTVWDTTKGRRLPDIDCDVDGVAIMTFTPDGTQLVLLSRRKGLHVHEVATGKRLRTLIPDDPPRGRAFYISRNFPTVSPDGRLLAVSADRDLYLWDLRTGRRLARREGVVGPAAFSPDGTWLTCVSERAVHWLEPDTLKVVRVSRREPGVAMGIAFSSDGRRLAVGSELCIRLWDVATGEPLPHPTGHHATVCSLAFSPDGRGLASGGRDGVAHVWDLATGRARHSFAGHSVSAAGLTFSPDGKRLATGDGSPTDTSGCREAQVRLFDLDTGRLVRRFPGHLDDVHALCFSPDGRKLATGGHDARIRLWHLASGRRLGQVRHLPNSRPISFLSGGKSLLVHQDVEGFCHLIDTSSYRTLSRFGMRSPSSASTVVVCRPGEREAAVFVDGAVLWYDLRQGKLLRSRPLEGEIPTPAGMLSPDAAVLACLLPRHHAIGLWDTSTGKQFATLTGHTSMVSVLAFSPDGTRLASGSSDTTVLLWDVERLRLEHRLGELLPGRSDLRALAVERSRAVAVLKARLVRAAETERRAARLLPDLDNEDFARRQKAHEELARLGVDAVGVLRRAAEAGPSPEVRLRARQLLDRIDRKELSTALDPARVRQGLLLLLELGTPAAHPALEELARLGPGTLVGREARLVLKQGR